MGAQAGRTFHPLRVLHVLCCLALGGLQGVYAWRHHPLRGQALRPAPRVGVSPGLPALGRELAWRLDLVRAVLPDVLGGLAVLGLFSLGTGVYVRRFEVWLEAQQSGEAAALRGVGLDQAALGANRDRRKGAIL